VQSSIKDFRFLLALLGATAPGVGYYLHDSTYHAILVAFVIVPLLDGLVGRSSAPSSPQEIARLEASLLFRGILIAYVPMQLGLIAWGAWLITRGDLSAAQALGLALSVGIVTGAQGITIGHELGHKRTRLERLLARVLLVTVSYGHFSIEHNRGHHVRVATREDPASARFGESFWAFLPRTLAGSWLHAWQLEFERLERAGLPRWGWRNEMLWNTLLPFAIAGLLAAAFGPAAALFFFVQSAMAVLLLEAVNYVEHYGLERARLSDSRYERVGARHSWDAYQTLSNCFLVHLQRHADHHLNPGRPYQALQPQAESPKLPAGYPLMVPLALLPPLWFAVMNPRAELARAAA
jgi:alkane 1-monooxygenase